MAAKRSTKKSAARGKKQAARRAKPAGKAKAKAKTKVKAKAAGAKKKVAAKRGAARKAAPAKPKAKAVSEATRSRFIWFDLVTPDVAKSHEFYTSLFGWSSKEMPVPPPGNKYTMFSSAGNDFGGLAPKMDSPAPTHWLPYVLVENVDQTFARVEGLGGKVFMPPMDIPNVGRFGIIADPTGGTVAPISFLTPPKAQPERSLVGPVAWIELFTDDTAKAGQFYTQLFGWTRTEVPMGQGVVYHMFKSGGRDVGGMFTRSPDQPIMWLTYFGTDDVDSRHRQAVTSGAREIKPPADIPNIGRFSILMDPQGAVFALFKGGPA